MKCAAATQVALLDVQAIDTHLDQVAYRRANLPEAAKVSELARELDRARDAVVRAEMVAHDLQREQTRADNDVAVVRERSAKDQALMDGGTIRDPKQLENLRHEVESLARRQADLEEIELEVMERVEAAERDVRTLTATRDELQAQYDAMVVTRDELLAVIADEGNSLEVERESARAAMPADLLKLYDKLRSDNGGIGAARLYRGACEGCRMTLTPSDVARIKAADVDEVVRCEECSRILVRTAESGLGA